MPRDHSLEHDAERFSRRFAATPQHGGPVGKPSGSTLPATLRSTMEGALGHDLSSVRIYADDHAADTARRLGAAALTIGDAVSFGADRYKPDSPDGRRLLAHELAHVAQQREIGPRLQMAPAGPVPASPPACVAVSGDIEGTPFLFVVGTDRFRPGEQDALAGVPAEVPAGTAVEVHGFASEEGSAALNEELSCKRAQMAWRVLVGNGLSPSQIGGIFNHGATPGPRAERRSALVVAPGMTIGRPAIGKPPSQLDRPRAQPVITGSLTPPGPVTISPAPIVKPTPKPAAEPSTEKKEEAKETKPEVTPPTPEPTPEPAAPLGWKKQRTAGLQLSPGFMYLSPGAKPDDVAGLFFLQFSAQHRDPEHPTFRQRFHLVPLELPEPQLQIGAGLDMSWDWHLLVQLVFNVIRIHLGDVDLSGQAGAQADFPRFELAKPSGTVLFGPSLQYQKEGSPWIFGANGQWNYDIKTGGLTFKNFNFSLSLSREF